MPGSLHLIELCLRFIPDHQNVILIANGLDKWEKHWVKEKFSKYPIIYISKTLMHSQVLDLLFDNFPSPFGIFDYDCFVFNPSYFQKMADFPPRAMVSATYAYTNPILKNEWPETFFLYFNTPLINSLKKKYKVNCGQATFHVLPEKLRLKLTVIGLDENHYPEDYKTYFDTLRLVWSLGLADGYEFHFVDRVYSISLTSEQVFHVGGVATAFNVTSLWKFRGAYLWHRALETQVDKALSAYYDAKYGKCGSNELLNKYPDFASDLSSDFFEKIESICAK